MGRCQCCYFRDRDCLKRFDVEIERCGKYVVVRPVGELDLAAVDILEAALSPVETEFGEIVIDLRQVEFLDSTGLRVILSADARSRSNGFRLKVINGTEQVRHVLALTGMDKHLPLIDAGELEGPSDQP
jgi:anti-sigma B factor antagonist